MHSIMRWLECTAPGQERASCFRGMGYDALCLDAEGNPVGLYSQR